MYTLIYYVAETEGQKKVERKYQGEQWRLKKAALNFTREIVRETYIEKGFATEDIKNGILCYKGEVTTHGECKITEVRVIVEKA